jgi:hypothetical protein
MQECRNEGMQISRYTELVEKWYTELVAKWYTELVEVYQMYGGIC